MGVDARRALILTETVVSTVLGLVVFAGAASAQCPQTAFDFTMMSTGNPPAAAFWPGGTATQGTAPCDVNVTQPSGDINLIGLFGDAWRMVTFGSGFSSCMLAGVCNPNGGICDPFMPCVGVDAPSACPSFLGIPELQ